MAVATYTKTGNKATTAARLDKNVFGVEVENHELLKQAYTMYLANGRVASATTKRRGEVSGGGRKPWKQKGTGRARFGSSRVPIWRGGGVVFGPTGEENYSKKMPVATKRKAIRQALSVASKDGHVSVIESFDPKGKTAEAAKILAKVGAERRTLIVVDKKTPEVVRATNNLQKVKVVQSTYLNVYDVLNADTVLFTAPALKETADWLNAVSKEAK